MKSKLFVALAHSDNEVNEIFGKEFIFIARLYSKYLTNINIPDLVKISIIMVDTPANNKLIPTHKTTKVCLIYEYLDFSVYRNESNLDNRLKLLLNYLLRTIEGIANKFGWDLKAFELAYSKVLDSNFKNVYVLINKKRSPDKNYSATILVDSKMDFHSIIIELQNTHSNSIERIEICKITYFEYDISRIIDSFEWITNDEVLVYNRDKEIIYKLYIKVKSTEVIIDPIKHHEQYLRDELILLDPFTSRDLYLKIIENRLKDFPDLNRKIE